MTDMHSVRVEALMLIERARTDPSAKWCLLTVDDESGKFVNVEGTWDEEIDAVAEGQRQRNEMARHLEPGEAGWTYVAVPYFEKPDGREA